MRALIFLLVIISTQESKAQPFANIFDDPKKQEIFNVMNQWWTAWETDNLSILENLSDERVIEYFGGEKRTEGKAALLNVARRIFPLQVLQYWKLTQPIVEIHGDAAICNYFFEETYLQNNEQKSGRGCWTFFLVKKGGQWKVVASHGTNF